MEDEVVREVEKAKAEWEETLSRTRELVGAIASCGKEEGMEEANSLPRLNGSAQDNLAILRSLQFKLDLRAQQMTTEDGVHSALSTLDSWKDLHHSVHSSLRNANLQAKANIRKAAQKEREILLGGGEESTIRRRNLQKLKEAPTHWRPLLHISDESTSVLKRAESEYKGHCSLLSRTRNLPSTIQCQDTLDRKHIEAIKDGTLLDLKLGFHKAGAGDPVLIQNHGGDATNPQIRAARMHDEL